MEDIFLVSPKEPKQNSKEINEALLDAVSNVAKEYKLSELELCELLNNVSFQISNKYFLGV